MNAPSASRQFAPDLIRAIGISLVVVLHVTGNLARVPGASGMINLGVHALTRISVPLFVMLSGWLLCDTSRPLEPTGRFLQHRLWRIGWPLLAWSGFYIGWRICYYGEHLSLRAWGAALASAGVYYHLWFLYLMLGLYVIVPFVRILLVSGDKFTIPLLFLLWLAMLLLPPLFHRLLNAEWIYSQGLPLDYVGYFVFGALVGGRSLGNHQKWLAMVAWVVGFLATWAATWFATAINEIQNPAWHGYLRPNVVLMSCGAFPLLVCWGRAWSAPPMITTIIRWIAQGSLGIYLLHPVFIELGATGRLGTSLNNLAHAEAAGRLIFAAIALFSCGLVVLLLRRVPAVRPLVS